MNNKELKMLITDWLRNEYGLDDGETLSAEEVSEAVEIAVIKFVREVRKAKDKEKLELIESVPCDNIKFQTGGINNNMAYTQTKKIEDWKAQKKKLINL